MTRPVLPGNGAVDPLFLLSHPPAAAPGTSLENAETVLDEGRVNLENVPTVFNEGGTPLANAPTVMDEGPSGFATADTVMIEGRGGADVAVMATEDAGGIGDAVLVESTGISAGPGLAAGALRRSIFSGVEPAEKLRAAPRVGVAARVVGKTPLTVVGTLQETPRADILLVEVPVAGGSGGNPKSRPAVLKVYHAGTDEKFVDEWHARVFAEIGDIIDFMGEARRVCPNVVMVQQMGRVGYQPAVMVDYTPGWDLHELCSKVDATKISVRAVLEMVRNLLTAARYFRDNDLVHGDFKESNARLRPDGVTVVHDLDTVSSSKGFAGRVNSSPHMYFTSSHAAPELLRRRMNESHADRVDVFAIGITLMRLLGGDEVRTLINTFGDTTPHQPHARSIVAGHDAFMRAVKAALKKNLDRLLFNVPPEKKDKIQTGIILLIENLTHFNPEVRPRAEDALKEISILIDQLEWTKQSDVRVAARALGAPRESFRKQGGETRFFVPFQARNSDAAAVAVTRLVSGIRRRTEAGQAPTGSHESAGEVNPGGLAMPEASLIQQGKISPIVGLGIFLTSIASLVGLAWALQANGAIRLTSWLEAVPENPEDEAGEINATLAAPLKPVQAIDAAGSSETTDEILSDDMDALGSLSASTRSYNSKRSAAPAPTILSSPFRLKTVNGQADVNLIAADGITRLEMGERGFTVPPGKYVIEVRRGEEVIGRKNLRVSSKGQITTKGMSQTLSSDGTTVVEIDIGWLVAAK